ncbi:2Fe-2S iron-sulfur cluster-binding protein [Streptomyces sp. L2]|uniref:2Fe-2S iron-sulfur cluster-binding protein n=1 Tax=Streptomyces sp. L2 TaxID=2162665 RepID=UPI001010750A|nr:2Fe-2S iron-sulfur cluster-binding protein [Streptomyces sp. L2]
MTDDPYAEGAAPQGAGRWDPLPQGDYDDGATAFVKLPEGGIDALLSGDSPLAAPGHGYVPPRITADSGESAAGTAGPEQAWPAPGGQWPDPNAVPHEQGAGADDRFTYQPAATQQWTYEEPAAPPAPGHDVTGQWSIPVAGGDLPDESGEFTTSSLVEQWGGGTPPATLPGGAPAPWATEGAGRPWGRPQQDQQAGEGQPVDTATPHTGPTPAHGRAHPGETGGTGALPVDGPAPTDAYADGRTYPEGLPADAPGQPGRRPADGPASGGGRSPDGSGTTDARPADGSAYAGVPATDDPAHTGSYPAGGPEDPDGSRTAGAQHHTGAPGRVDGHADAAHVTGGSHAGPGVPDGSGPGYPADSARPAPASGHSAADDAGEDVGAAVPADGRTGADGYGPAQGPGASADVPAAHTPDGVSGPAPQAGTRPATAAGVVAAGEHTAATGPAGSADATGAIDAAGAADTPAPAGSAGSAADGPDAPGTQADADRGATADADRRETADEHGAADGPDAGDLAPVPPHDDHPLASYVLRVNGGERPVTDAWIGESLLYVLRERLGLAGAKDGCSQGECGACNVQVDGRLVASCLVPAVTAAGSEVRTVEGLAVDGQSSDVQRALARCGAVQCGFCVPGMAMTLHDLLEGNPAPTELETRQALCGNLCRCTGYRGVLEAVKEVVAERETQAGADTESDGDEARIPHQAGPGSGGVNPSAFDAPGVFDPPGGFGAPGTMPGQSHGPGPAQGHGQGPHEQTYGQDGGQR